MFSSELTRSIDSKYKKAYHKLNSELKKSVDSKKYFVGSHDELGYYQPDLTDYITDSHSRKGKYVKSPPDEKSYFEYWYSGGRLVKIKFLCNNDYSDDYDVIPVYSDSGLIYLFYSIDFNGEVSLSNFYILKYGENGGLLRLDKYIRQGISDKFDFSRAEYSYYGSRLTKAVICDGFRENTYEFEYDTQGCLASAVLSDGQHSYTLDISGKAEKFRKSGMYHFG